jgi:hypothetical protein
MPRYTLADMHKWAKKRGGKCLSEKYVNCISPLEWQCAKGHIWMATPDQIKNRNIWCTKCNKINKKAKMLNRLQIIAEQHRGKCLSKEYVNINTSIDWECQKGHRWSARPETVQNGKWCPFCKKQKRKVPWLKQMQEIAEQHGGKCLSKEYINGNSPLLWQCEKGHKWKATPRIVSNFAIWCTKCNKINKIANALKRLQKIAEDLGGKCLSTKYINMNTPMKWQCKNGHIWSTLPRYIINGTWCPECKKSKKKK